MAKILIVEDDRRIARFLEIELTHEGHEVRKADNGVDALIEFEEFKPDVVVLDLMLPEMNGIEVAKRIRERSESVGIIMLTALGDTKDKVRGLKSGADDYVVKPFETEELLARIEALLRRRGVKRDEVLEYGPIKLFPALRRVEVNGEEIKLSKTEFDLLEYLMRNAEIVLSKERILDAVWKDEFYGSNVVEVYVNYLRKKLKDAGKLLKTVWGVGYVLRE